MSTQAPGCFQFDHRPSDLGPDIIITSEKGKEKERTKKIEKKKI